MQYYAPHDGSKNVVRCEVKVLCRSQVIKDMKLLKDFKIGAYKVILCVCLFVFCFLLRYK